MIILGIDPGQTTGLAWWNVEDSRFSIWAQQTALTAVLTVWDWLESYQRDGVPVEVACERYVISQRTLRASRQYDALYVSGSAWGKCGQLDLPYFEYPSSETKRQITDDRLQRLDTWQPGQGHVHDAMRVALTHLARTRPVEFQRLLDRSRSSG